MKVFVFCYTAADKFSETVNIIANEPSLAFFRIQEHVRKTLPQLVDQKVYFRYSFCIFGCEILLLILLL